ncbi:hypothetical protein PVAND_008453 [Polypedilum vanderplanki]|uniref:Uncharacterized protein n=1 Tax=Polypedilum vanderplanki TaxID=319348 RepID=A0A9J6CAP0_POLVA|nr:hypothetical protein PVAND_008453 [Polypedilum vanderplanki]
MNLRFIKLIIFLTALSKIDGYSSLEVNVQCTYEVSYKGLYTCILGRVNINSPNQILIITGNHLPGYSDEDVFACIPDFAVTNNNFRFFNGEILRKFHNLKFLQIDSRKLEGFSFNAFTFCSQLQELEFFGGNVTNIYPGLLEHCQNLDIFTASQAEVWSFPGQFFGNSQKLRKFTLTVSNMNTLPENLFQNSVNLWNVNLFGNEITTLPANLLSNSRNLVFINLSYNLISDPNVIENLLNGLLALEFINLRGNNFTNFNFGFFSQFSNLRNLSIGGRLTTNFTNINWTSLPRSLRELNVLNIGESITGTAFFHLTNLRRLQVSGSNIRNFDPNTFSTLENLEILILSNCGLTTLHPQLFNNLRNVFHLSLYQNNIEELPPNIFASLENLGNGNFQFSRESLELGDNKIKELNSNSFGHHLHMTHFSINRNEVYKIEPGIFARNFPNLVLFSAFQNKCVSAFIQQKFDDNPYLEYCFANWLGITTTTTDGSNEISKINFIIIGFFVAILWRI